MEFMNPYAITKKTNFILEIILNQPERLNSIFTDSYESMNAALNEATHPDIRCVILRGEGKAFCVGGDIRSFQEVAKSGEGVSKHDIDLLHSIIRKICSLQKPVIALVHGACTGAGLSLALACDLIFAAENTKFNLAYSSVGLSPDGGSTYFLPQIVGLKKAMEIFLTAKTFSAQRALDLGLINRIEIPEKLVESGLSFAHSLSQGPTSTFKKIKNLLYSSFNNSLDQQLSLEALYFSQSTKTEDFKTRINSFIFNQCERNKAKSRSKIL